MLINDVKYYRQKDARHCGPTVVSMVLSKFGYEITQDQIANVVMKINASGIKLSYMYHIAGHIADLGFWSIYSGALSDENAWNILINAIKERTPVIVLQRYSKTDASGHYRVILGVDEVGKKNTVVITYHDPADNQQVGGPYKQIKKEDFMELWEKKQSADLEYDNTLLVIKNERINVSKDRCNYCKSKNVEIDSVNYNNPPNSYFINTNTRINGRGTIIHCKDCNGRLVYFIPSN